MKTLTTTVLVTLAAALAGCQPRATVHHQVDPIKVEPIHLTVDINIKVDRQLDDFFEFQEQYTADEDADIDMDVVPGTPATSETSGTPGNPGNPRTPGSKGA